MANSNNESGHANNVANIKTMVSKCVGLGNSYQPSNPNLSIAFLQGYTASASDALKDVQVKKTAFDNALNDRNVLYAKVRPLSTRVINALKSLGLRVETVKNATTVNRKIQGQRATPVPTLAKSLGAAVANENQTIPKTISASQQGIDQVISNFSQLIEIARAEPTYAPNETDLTIASLDALYNELHTKNQLVNQAETELNKARIARNKLLYNNDVNIVSLAQGIKNYLKSAFGPNSPEYKMVGSIKIVSLAR
ncbi:MAG TPA: hypothetical protein VHO72_10360 [Bacteroidales bacterium]|nr:hypothetical protein [Bacteroidales bacterium]